MTRMGLALTQEGELHCHDLKPLQAAGAAGTVLPPHAACASTLLGMLAAVLALGRCTCLLHRSHAALPDAVGFSP